MYIYHLSICIYIYIYHISMLHLSERSRGIFWLEFLVQSFWDLNISCNYMQNGGICVHFSRDRLNLTKFSQESGASKILELLLEPSQRRFHSSALGALCPAGRLCQGWDTNPWSVFHALLILNWLFLVFIL